MAVRQRAHRSGKRGQCIALSAEQKEIITAELLDKGQFRVNEGDLGVRNMLTYGG